MSRTPKHSEVETRSYYIDSENSAFISARTQETQRSPTECINAELDFLRTWGLSKLSVPRLMAAAEAARATPMQYVQNLVWSFARDLPPVPPPKANGPSQMVRTSSNFTGPNLALILNHSISEGTDFPATLNNLLRFARTLGLPANLLAAMTAHAEARDGSMRDLVLTLVSDVVARLPDVASLPSTRPRPPRTATHKK